MNQLIMIKGKLLTLCVRKKTKSRQANSSIGYFEINGKAIVPYDLKHYLRVTCYHSPSESFAPEHEVFELKNKWIKDSDLGSKVTQDLTEIPWISIAESDTNDTVGKPRVILPHEIKKNHLRLNTWNWLSWSMKNNSPITGRIARSLQRAGICVLIGGFVAFLPYKEYSVRNKIICAKEAELQSFQILSIKRSNFNCVLSKDRVTYKYDRDWIH